MKNCICDTLTMSFLDISIYRGFKMLRSIPVFYFLLIVSVLYAFSTNEYRIIEGAAKGFNFSHDSQTIVSWTDRQIQFWNLEQNRMVSQIIVEPTLPVLVDVGFSNDDSKIYVISTDHEKVRIWDVDGTLLRVLGEGATSGSIDDIQYGANDAFFMGDETIVTTCSYMQVPVRIYSLSLVFWNWKEDTLMNIVSLLDSDRRGFSLDADTMYDPKGKFIAIFDRTRVAILKNDGEFEFKVQSIDLQEDTQFSDIRNINGIRLNKDRNKFLLSAGVRNRNHNRIIEMDYGLSKVENDYPTVTVEPTKILLSPQGSYYFYMGGVYEVGSNRLVLDTQIKANANEDYFFLFSSEEDLFGLLSNDSVHIWRLVDSTSEIKEWKKD